MTDIAARRKAIIAKIEARRANEGGGSGGMSVHYGHVTPSVERISTGSPQLDYATAGGVPIGRWTRMYGGKSSGKSLTCWNVAREAQHMGLEVVYCNIEKQYDPDFTAACGVDVTKLLVVEGTIIEEVGQDVQDLLEVADVFIFDSCSEGTSNEEASGEMEDKFYAASPRAWNRVFKKVQEKFDHTRHTVIYTDHIRDVFGGQGGVQPPGGKLMEHRSSLTLYFRMGSWLFRNKEGRLVEEAEAGHSMSGYTEADGIEVLVRAEKNRVGRPFRMARLHYDLDGARLDIAWELAQAAMFLDEDGISARRSGKPAIIAKTTPKSSWYALPGGKQAQGANGLAKALEQDAGMRKHIEECMRKGWRPEIKPPPSEEELEVA